MSLFELNRWLFPEQPEGSESEAVSDESMEAAPGSEAPKEDKSTAPPEPSETAAKPKKNWIPEDRFNKVIAERNQHRAELERVRQEALEAKREMENIKYKMGLAEAHKQPTQPVRDDRRDGINYPAHIKAAMEDQNWGAAFKMMEEMIKLHMNPLGEKVQGVEKNLTQNYQRLREERDTDQLNQHYNNLELQIEKELGPIAEGYPNTNALMKQVDDECYSALIQRYGEDQYGRVRGWNEMSQAVRDDIYRQYWTQAYKAKQAELKSYADYHLTGKSKREAAARAAMPAGVGKPGTGVPNEMQDLTARWKRHELTDEEYERLYNQMIWDREK